MFIGIDKIPPHERQRILVLGWAVENSQELNQLQKSRIEEKLQQIVNIWVSGCM